MARSIRIINSKKFYFIISKIEATNNKNPELRQIVFDNGETYNPQSSVSYALLKDYLKSSEKTPKGILRKSDIDFILEDNKTCFYCNEKTEKEDRTIDHCRPKFFNGTNLFSNIKVSCSSCNHMKGAIHPERMKFTYNLFKENIVQNKKCSSLHILLRSKTKLNTESSQELEMVNKVISTELYWRKKAGIILDLEKEEELANTY